MLKRISVSSSIKKDLYPSRLYLRVVYLSSLILWMTSIGMARSWAAEAGLNSHWTFNVAPSLFAGIAVTLMVALAMRLRPLTGLLSGAVIMLLAEIVQLWHSSYVFDVLDVTAGVSGAALGALSLYRNLQRCRAFSGMVGDEAR